MTKNASLLPAAQVHWRNCVGSCPVLPNNLLQSAVSSKWLWAALVCRQGAFHTCHQNLHKVLTGEQRESFVQKQACSGWSAKQFYLLRRLTAVSKLRKKIMKNSMHICCSNYLNFNIRKVTFKMRTPCI